MRMEPALTVSPLASRATEIQMPHAVFNPRMDIDGPVLQGFGLTVGRYGRR